MNFGLDLALLSSHYLELQPCCCCLRLILLAAAKMLIMLTPMSKLLPELPAAFPDASGGSDDYSSTKMMSHTNHTD
jgi:hypothetical protein